MVYVDPKNLGFLPYWQKWVSKWHERDILDQLFAQLVPAAIEFVCEGVDGSNQDEPLKTVIVQTSLNMITQLCYMFDAMLPLNDNGSPATDESGGGAAEEEIQDVVINSDVIAATFLMVSFFHFRTLIV